ncbi:MAG: Uma2 family endonuclease [Deltaproteobacteria bacterium]|nr:Uma2 family endonuclease [Deltaproteobacteria bacterium]
MQTHAGSVSSVAAPLPISTIVQCVVLDGVSWETYVRLLAEHGESGGAHFTYDRGRLEIMVLSAAHEALKHALEVLVEIFAEELNIDVRGFGSTTFRRADLERGFEPDACFYIRQEPSVRGKREIRLTVDPPPDLVIEIDISHSSLNKLPIFAALGIPEVWHHDGTKVTIVTLEASAYREVAESAALPGVTGEVLSRFVETNTQLQPTLWRRSVRDWARNCLTPVRE